jgi:hypothetical protein
LYEINAKGGVSKLLAQNTNLESGSIMGYDSSNHIVYLMSSFGDAGVYSYTVYAYSYADGKVSKVVADSGGSDDPPAQHAEAQATLSAIKSSIGSISTTSALIRVKGGHLIRPLSSDVPSQLSYPNFIFPE